MEALERHVYSQDWITLLLLFVFILLVIAKYAFPHRFNNFVMLFATDKYVVLGGRKTKIFHPFNVLLFLINIIIVSLLIFVFLKELELIVPSRPKILFIRIATAYTTFVLLKFGVEKILANVISVDEQMDYYLFYKLSYRNYMALALLPVCMIFIYTWSPDTIVLYLLLSVLLVLNFIVIAGVYRKNQRFILNHWFYFILYLCALEIGPYFILYKLITKL